MKTFLFRLSRLISIIGHTVGVIAILFFAYTVIENQDGYKYWNGIRVISSLFLTIILPQIIILIFNWLSFGKLSLWVKKIND
jgi:hypothetical protein